MNLAKIDEEQLLMTRRVEEEVLGMTNQEALEKIWLENDDLREQFKKNILRIEIAGNIGSGKTTLAQLIALHGGGIPTLFEQVENNELLKKYYQDKKRYGERFQIDAMDDRGRRYLFHTIMRPEESFISDRTRAEDVDAFCPALNELGFLTDESYKYLRWYFDYKNNQLEEEYGVSLKPDYIIFIKQSWQRTNDQVKIRSRDLELGVDAKTEEFVELLEALHNEYDQNFVRRLRGHYDVPILTLSPSNDCVLDATKSRGQYFLIKTVNEGLRIAYDSEA